MLSEERWAIALHFVPLKKPVGGGYGVNGPAPFSTYFSAPLFQSTQPVGWVATINNESTGTQVVFAYVICVIAL